MPTHMSFPKHQSLPSTYLEGQSVNASAATENAFDLHVKYMYNVICPTGQLTKANFHSSMTTVLFSHHLFVVQPAEG